LPPQEQSFCVEGEENSTFHGIYAGTTRIGDVAVQVRNQDEELETTLVIEIGFSQDYESIINACQSWLEGTKTVRMCVVVFFEEQPKYRCPLDINMDDELFERMKFPDEEDLRQRDIYMAGPFGPALFKRLPDDEDTDETEADDQEELANDEAETDDDDADETEADDQAELANDEAETANDEAETTNDEAETAEEEDEGEANLPWVGNISTAFLECWKLNPRSNKAVRCGRRTVSYLFLMRISLTN
jgi:hypothetical protein